MQVRQSVLVSPLSGLKFGFLPVPPHIEQDVFLMYSRPQNAQFALIGGLVGKVVTLQLLD